MDGGDGGGEGGGEGLAGCEEGEEEGKEELWEVHFGEGVVKGLVGEVLAVMGFAGGDCGFIYKNLEAAIDF